jgi:aryl-alcohol dehydrogenase-like predicted oxidoreductase
MEKRQLGQTDLHITPLVLGGNVFGWTIDEPASFKVLDAFTEAGFNMIDTADVYSTWAPGNKGGESETIIGNWLQKRNNRQSVLVATKAGSDMGDGKKGVTKKYILAAAEDSLRRLQTDYIDLYQTHFDDETTPVEETLAAYDQLKKQGKVRWIGTSNMSPARILESLETANRKNYPAYQSLQPEYNLYAREKFETQYEKVCLDHHIGVINYYSLASGFLSGKYRTEKDFGKSARGRAMSKYLNPRGFAILDALDKLASAHKTNPTAIALAWLIARPSITAPIASATSVAQLQELAAGAQLVLGADEIELLNQASNWK